MEKSELIYLATVAFGKDMEYEKFKYSDYMYGKENEIDDVWEYVEELEDYGTIAFKEKYKEFNMYYI